jgi:hypothetical protein
VLFAEPGAGSSMHWKNCTLGWPHHEKERGACRKPADLHRQENKTLNATRPQVANGRRERLNGPSSDSGKTAVR